MLINYAFTNGIFPNNCKISKVIPIYSSKGTNHKWNAEYCENASRLRAFVPGTGARPVGMGLPQAAWVKLNRLRAGVGRFHSSMHKWVSLLHRIASVASLSKPQTMF